MKLRVVGGEIVSTNVRVADRFQDRLLGLMFKKSLEEGESLYISPCNSIHTFFMMFSLDVAFVDKNLKVVKVLSEMKPWRMSWLYLNAHSVVEMKAGTLSLKIKEGDTLEFYV